MESVNKAGKRRRKNRKRSAPQVGRAFPAEKMEVGVNTQGLSELHMSCLYGQLASLQLLDQSAPGRINSSDPQGRRPVHMVVSSRSSPDTSACLRYLLDNGAHVRVTTDAGQTPLHLAASEGLLDCTEMLVQAGADVTARDNMGHTPLDMARIWCHREVARFLKSCTWKEEKRKETEERRRAQALYSDLVDKARLNNLNKRTLIDEKMAEWADKKGFPHLKDVSTRAAVSRYHSGCLSSHQPQPESRTNYAGLQRWGGSRSEPDLRDRVTVWREGNRRPRYNTEWDSRPCAAPDLPLDVLKRVLFPRAFPPRMPSPQHCEPQSIVDVPHKRSPQGRSTSPWTEVAMHLAGVLDPGASGSWRSSNRT